MDALPESRSSSPSAEAENSDDGASGPEQAENSGTSVHDASNLRKRAEIVDSIARAGLVIVAGAGVSLQSIGTSDKSVNLAGWPGLLYHGVTHCLKHQLLAPDEAGIVRLQIEMGERPGKTDYLIEAAQRIHDCLDKRVNGRYWWLYESIGQLKVQNPRLIRAIQGTGALITTLNYDSLLEQVTGYRAIEWSQRTEVTSCMHDRERDVVMHLHGFWKKPEGIILDRLSYELIKSNNDTRDLLRDFARNYTLLFIGCGGTFFDPNLQALLSWAKEALHGVQHRHYIMCRQSDEPKLFTSLQTHGYLDSLVYGEKYGELSAFLEHIGKESGASAKAKNPPVVSNANMNMGTIDKALKPADIWKLQSQD